MAQPLLLAAPSLPSVALPEIAREAAAAGFDGLAAWRSQVDALVPAEMSAPELGRVLRDVGAPIVQLEVVAGWSDLEAEDERAERESAQAIECAAALGARALLAVRMKPAPADVSALAERFGCLCDLAAPAGLEINLEFLPWTGIADLATALAVVEQAGRPNGGVLIDTWHWLRSGGTLDDLKAAPPARVQAIQLNDAPRVAEENVLDETMHRRRLPGEGDGDIVGFLRTLDAMGVECPIHIEVFSDEIASLPPREAVACLSEGLRDILSQARR